MPGLIEFFLFGIAGGIFQKDPLGRSAKGAFGSRSRCGSSTSPARAGDQGARGRRTRFEPPANIYELAEYASEILCAVQLHGRGLAAHGRDGASSSARGAPNVVCTQPFACLPNHVVGKAVIKELRRRYPESNIVAVDYDPGASEVNQLNRIKLMISGGEERTLPTRRPRPAPPARRRPRRRSRKPASSMCRKRGRDGRQAGHLPHAASGTWATCRSARLAALTSGRRRVRRGHARDAASCWRRTASSKRLERLGRGAHRRARRRRIVAARAGRRGHRVLLATPGMPGVSDPGLRLVRACPGGGRAGRGAARAHRHGHGVCGQRLRRTRASTSAASSRAKPASRRQRSMDGLRTLDAALIYLRKPEPYRRRACCAGRGLPAARSGRVPRAHEAA